MSPISITQNANVGKRKNRKNVLGCMGTIISNVKTLVKERSKKDEVEELKVEDIIAASKKEVAYVANLLSMSQVQVIMMAACLERCNRHRNDLSVLAETLSINYLRLLEFNDDIQDLKKRGYMRIDKDNNVSLPHEVLDALKCNTAYIKPGNTGLSTIGMMRRLKEMFDRIDDDEMDDNVFLEEALVMIEDNPDTSFSKEFKNLRIEEYCHIETQLFLYLAHLFYNQDDDEINRSQIEDAFASEDNRDSVLSWIHRGNLCLMDDSIIEFVNTDGMKSKDYIHIEKFEQDAVVDFVPHYPVDEFLSLNQVRDGKRLAQPCIIVGIVIDALPLQPGYLGIAHIQVETEEFF